MTLLKCVFCLAVMAVSLRNVRAHLSKESKMVLMKGMHDTLVECAKEFNLNLDDVKEQQSSKGSFDGVDKCLFRCILKSKGALNDEGKYDLDKGLKNVREVVTNDDDYKLLETALTTCASVNDEEVSDGNEGCERAFLFSSCVKKHIGKE